MPLGRAEGEAATQSHADISLRPLGWVLCLCLVDAFPHL